MIPLPRELSRCRSCERPVLWTVTRAGRRLAVDPRPDEKGNQACYRVGPRTWQSRSLNAADAQPLGSHEHRYMPHVATCKPPARREPPVLPDNVIRIDTKRRRPR